MEQWKGKVSPRKLTITQTSEKYNKLVKKTKE